MMTTHSPRTETQLLQALRDTKNDFLHVRDDLTCSAAAGLAVGLVAVPIISELTATHLMQSYRRDDLVGFPQSHFEVEVDSPYVIVLPDYTLPHASVVSVYQKAQYGNGIDPRLLDRAPGLLRGLYAHSLAGWVLQRGKRCPMSEKFKGIPSDCRPDVYAAISGYREEIKEYLWHTIDCTVLDHMGSRYIGDTFLRPEQQLELMRQRLYYVELSSKKLSGRTMGKARGR